MVTKAKVKRSKKIATEIIAPKSKWTLVDNQKRAKLAEGRSHGLGVGFAKREGDVLTTVNPISACKDYCSDQVTSEWTGKVLTYYGLTTKKEDIFSDGRGYLIASVLKQGARNPKVYCGYEKDVKALADNYLSIQSALNHVEEKLNIKDRTVIEPISKNLFVVIAPLWWCQATYRISLYLLLMRAALYYESGDPIEYWTNLKDTDTYLLKEAIPKLNRMIKEGCPDQDWTKEVYWHNWGIVTAQIWQIAPPKVEKKLDILPPAPILVAAI